MDAPHSHSSSTYAIMLVTVVALLTGAGNSFATKLLLSSSCSEVCGPGGSTAFNKPIFATLVAFCGMALSIILYSPRVFIARAECTATPDTTRHMHRRSISRELIEDVRAHRLSMPHEDGQADISDSDQQHLLGSSARDDERKPHSHSPKSESMFRRYSALSVPALFDVIATMLQAISALWIPAAVITATRGSLILFTAGVATLTGVKDRAASAAEWRGIFISLIGIACVGVSAVLESSGSATTGSAQSGVALTVLGIALATSSNLVQAFQISWETKYMEGAQFSPLEVNAGEGMIGAVLIVLILGVVQAIPFGADGGHVEDSVGTVCCLEKNSTLWGIAIGMLLLFSCSALAHMKLSLMRGSNFRAFIIVARAVIVWGLELFTYYGPFADSSYGEPWGRYGWLEGAGFLILAIGGIIQFRAQSARERSAAALLKEAELRGGSASAGVEVSMHPPVAAEAGSSQEGAE